MKHRIQVSVDVTDLIANTGMRMGISMDMPAKKGKDVTDTVCDILAFTVCRVPDKRSCMPYGFKDSQEDLSPRYESHFR